jgi:N utilization substance protein B
MNRKETESVAKSRRRARVLALQVLYEADVVGHDPMDVLHRTLAEEECDAETAAYARHLIDGVVTYRAEIDQRLNAAAPAWPLDQMPPVDKNLLRLAIYELLFDNRHVPMKAVINEAVEIAKIFGSESSSRFVNGVLGTVVAGQAT